MIKENITNILATLNDQVRLVAVSKTKPNDAILEAYEMGQLDFGENKVQDLVAKYEALPKDIRWHFIGHMQTNKVKYIAPFVHLLHSVDSIKLLNTIQKEGLKNNRTIRVLLQIKIAEEDSKFGLTEDALHLMLRDGLLERLDRVHVVGLMGMATNTNDKEKVKNEFLQLKNMFDRVKARNFKDDNDFSVLSMGMSNDYLLAVEAGSTMVRIGSSIFGARVY